MFAQGQMEGSMKEVSRNLGFENSRFPRYEKDIVGKCLVLSG